MLNPFFLFDYDSKERVFRFGLQKAFETGRIGKVRTEVEQRRIDLQEARLNIQVLDLKNQVTEAYAILYINQEKINILSEAYDFITLKIEESDKTILEIDQILIEEELLTIEHQIDDAKIAVKKAKGTLENLIGEELDETQKLEPPTEEQLKKEFNIQELIITALQKRAVIIENEKEMELALSLKKLAKADYWPLIIADSGARINMEENTASALIGLDIELPVLGLEKKQVEASIERIEQVEEKRKIIEKEIKLEVKDSYEVFDFSRNRLIHYQNEHLPRINELIIIIREKYNKGEITGRELLRAEKARITIFNNYFNALFEFESAFSNLERAVGIALVEEKENGRLPPDTQRSRFQSQQGF